MKNHDLSLIWDLPTRVFHWLTVFAFVSAWVTHDDDRFVYFHVFSGYVFFGLLLFRLLWGVIGSHYSRFHSFAHSFRSVLEYLKSLLDGKAMRYIGHNPAGGWAIFLMIMLGLVVSVTGILVLGGEEQHGLLAGFIDFRIGIISHEMHETVAWVMLIVTLVHVTGVVVESLVHKENLIWTMISGVKESKSAPSVAKGHHLIGLLIVVIVCVSSFSYFRGYLVESADDLYLPYRGPLLPDNETWRSECSDCHFAYHPSLLPARSWRNIFVGQHDHFGDDLDLEEETISELLTFHVDNSAEKGLTEPSRKILYNTPDHETPLRVSETVYIRNKHSEINAECWSIEKVLSRSNCNACHLDANEGTYEDSDMRLPGECGLD